MVSAEQYEANERQKEKIRKLEKERNELQQQVADRDEIIRMLTFQNSHSMWTLTWQQVQAHTNPRVRALMVSKR